MLKDKGVVVANPAMGMDHACALEPAVHGGAFMLQGCSRSEVRLKAVGSDAFGAWQVPRRCFRRALARSTLAAALASLLPLYSATAQETQVQDARDASPPAEEGRADGDPTQLDTVQVTGTRIKGGSVPSPVITIGSERIREEGFTDLGQVIRSVPQNFSGGQNPGVAVGATAGAGGLGNQNVTGGSSLNLRGLGPDATLTLLNGRRLSYGGFVQAVDISAIPVEAVERIEIVPDGASAIYGSDAVGGVGNIILRHDFEGIKAGWRYGGATDGGLTTREYSITAGTRWDSGGLIATYKDVSTDPIYAHQRDYTAAMFDPSTIYPGSDLRSGLLSVHQSLGEVAELHLDAVRTSRGQEIYPFNTGLTSYYSHIVPQTTTLMVAPGVDFFLANDWTLSLGGSWGRDRHINNQDRIYPVTGQVSTRIRECYCNRSFSWEIGAEGPVMSLPAGDARLALGAGRRKNTFTIRDHLTDTNTIEGGESTRFAYAELSVPVIGPDQTVPGVRRLDVTAAVRIEDYDSFGAVTTPKLGLIYSPSEDVTLKASWGKSFKAPTLFQRYQSRAVELDPASWYGWTGGGDSAGVLGIYGGARDLEPEHATTRSASVAFHPASLPGLEAEVTWFDIDYTDRVIEPVTDYAQTFLNPGYAQFIDLAPTPERLAALIASGAFNNYLGEGYDPADVVAIVYAQYANVARQNIHGLDFSASYRFDLGAGRLALRGSATWLDITQRNSAQSEAIDVSGLLFNPARLNARAGTVWDQGGYTASLFANYTSGVTDRTSGRKTASFTTFDTALRYAVDRQAGALSGVEVALSAQNLLDRAPPSYPPLSLAYPPYDSTNYSAIGRFVSLSVSKQW